MQSLHMLRISNYIETEPERTLRPKECREPTGFVQADVRRVFLALMARHKVHCWLVRIWNDFVYDERVFEKVLPRRAFAANQPDTITKQLLVILFAEDLKTSRQRSHLLC